MKYLKPSPRLIAVLSAALFSSQILHAATPVWNNASGGNWSENGNWTTSLAPQPIDDVQFGDVGAGAQNTMDTAFAIDSLTYNHDNGLVHTTVLNPGTTLTINRTSSGTNVLMVNSTTAAAVVGTLVQASIQGPGAALNISGAGDIVIRQGFGAQNGAHMATLDLSALDTFNANVGHLLIGQALAGESVNRPSGTLILAKTNTLTMNGPVTANVASVMVQDGGSNGNGTLTSVLSLGQVNFLYADTFRLGGQKGNGSVLFNPAFSNPSLVIRNVDQTTRATMFIVGEHSIVGSGNNTVASVDLTLGSVDALIDTAYIGKGNPGGASGGTCTASLGIAAGTFDVNTLELGFGVATSANGVTTSTLVVGNNGLVTTNNSIVSTGAVLRVNTTLRLARTNGSTGAINGTLNINGGTVLANNIVAGGGISTIALMGGSLVVSNNAGTLAAPIRNFSTSDSTLTLPALNAGAVLVASNFLAGGGQNIINIGSVPPIGSYPAVFTLVSYRNGASGNCMLGSMPSSSPPYQGTIIDLGNGVIQLQLTSGPLADLSLLWTGVADGDWDTSTFNWSYRGSPSNFFAGATPIFDDTSTQPFVNLATALSSGTVTISNSAVDYYFSGFGNIAGASALAKYGTKTVTFDNVGVDNFGSVTINNGTLQIGSGSVNGEISTPTITDNGALVVNRSGTLGLDSAIGGSGSLTKLGDGTLVLSGVSTYNGPTMLADGGLQVDGTLSGAGAVTVAVGTTLSGKGSASGPVTVAGTLNPGTVGAPGTFTATGPLTFSSGATLALDLSGAASSDPTASDSLTVGGNLTLNNNTITANIMGVPAVGNFYSLITYAGTLSGSFNPVVTGSHFTLAVDSVSSAGLVYLQITGGAGANLRWNSSGDPTWDSILPNWMDLDTSSSSQFFSGDTVLFDDSNVATGVTISGAVYPAAITNISDNNNFVIDGSGKISGNGGIVKGGTSTLAINTANDFSGVVDIQGGILKAGSDSALGSAAAGTTVEPGASLDIGGRSLAGEVISISGAGFNNQGAIINSGGVPNTAFRSLVLLADASIGGSNQWAINNSGGPASLSTGGLPLKLTKVGPNLVGLQNMATIDAALGDIEVAQGTLEFNGLTASMGDPLHTNFVDAGATLQFSSTSAVWNKFFNFTGNGTTASVNNGTSASTELAGSVELHGPVILNSGGTALTISGQISGPGSLTKIGSTAMVLSSNETYTGDTHINVGAMRLAGTATISNTPNIFINAGATLTVTGRVDATFTLLSSQNLSGNGTIAGALATTAGSTVSPGTNTIGILTISNTITLGGTTVMDVDQADNTNDVMFCNNGITYGGTLSIVNTNVALTNGASFKLFKAGSYNGVFSSITPSAPGNGLAWNTNTLSTGVLSVKTGPSTGPTTNATITRVQAAGTNLVIHGVNNNVPNTSFRYVVLTSTNLALPLSSWTAVVTNPFNSDGTFDYTNPIVTTKPRQFLDIIAVP